MPSKNKKNGSKPPAQGRPAKAGKKKKQSKPSMGGMAGYARMLQDPCAAPIGPGLYGTGNGYALRFHNSIPSDTAAPSGAFNSGFILYCPNYHCEGGSTLVGGTLSSVNLLTGIATSSASLIPLRGLTLASTTLPLSYSPPDPAYAFMSSGTPQDARCVGACVRIGFEQSVSNLQGRLAYLDLPQNIIDESLATGLSVDQLFALSRKVVRADIEMHEIRWKPNEADSTFRAPAAKATAVYDDATYRYDSTLGGYALSNGKYTTQENRWIGFAYYGLNSTFGYQTRYDVYKNIEWRPKQGLGMALPNEGKEAAISPMKYVESILPEGWQVSDVYQPLLKAAKTVVGMAWQPNAASSYPSIMPF